MQKIPFVDLYAQYQSIKQNIDEAITSTIKNTTFIGGKPVQDFEQAFAGFIGVKHTIGCANGTDSIEILLQAYGIGKGDEVIVPAASWISTSEAVSTAGATAVFVDVEEDYFTINPALIEAAITPNTKAIIPVHLYGHPADMPAIMAIAQKNNLIVIEDCAQSHASSINGKLTGTFGHAASFSFYPGKNLGAYGDAGCMATNDDAIAENARMIANHGQKGKHNHIIEGRNSRLDGLQAAILSAKLPYLHQWTHARIALAALYNSSISNLSFTLPKTKENYKHVFHLYVIRSNRRDALKDELNTLGIETAIHYPCALPFLNCYANQNFIAGSFPVAENWANTVLSLPMYAELTHEQLQYVTDALNQLQA
ncbi:MAG: DegT/DnrJ/EryC1/StrS family aminotransferase [Bacteroidetes bacterium]|nr:DegT/DnrJ/EryC1/StrS family aminotransferase [Bacteroidota bacterium]